MVLPKKLCTAQTHTHTHTDGNSVFLTPPPNTFRSVYGTSFALPPTPLGLTLEKKKIKIKKSKISSFFKFSGNLFRNFLRNNHLRRWGMTWGSILKK